VLLIETGGYAHGRSKPSLNSVRQTKLVLLNDSRGNPAKSAAVTQEISEIVGGAAAV